MNKDQIQRVVDILTEACAMDSHHVESLVLFLEEGLSDCTREYRFQGSLGFGGKLYWGHRRLWVDYYVESSTPARRVAKRTTNQRLQEIWP